MFVIVVALYDASCKKRSMWSGAIRQKATSRQKKMSRQKISTNRFVRSQVGSRYTAAAMMASFCSSESWYPQNTITIESLNDGDLWNGNIKNEWSFFFVPKNTAAKWSDGVLPMKWINIRRLFVIRSEDDFEKNANLPVRHTVDYCSRCLCRMGVNMCRGHVGLTVNLNNAREVVKKNKSIIITINKYETHDDYQTGGVPWSQKYSHCCY